MDLRRDHGAASTSIASPKKGRLMPISKNLAGHLEYDPYTDSRDWTEFTFVDFVRPTMVDVSAERLNSLLGKLNKEDISRLTRDPAIIKLRRERGHSETQTETKATEAFFASVADRPVAKGLDPAAIRRLANGEQKQTGSGNAYRLAYILRCRVSDFLKQSSELDPHLAELIGTVERLVKASVEKLAPNHPLPEFIEHQLSSVVKAVKCAPTDIWVTIPATAYGSASLSQRSSEDRKNSRAIADLTQLNIEKDLWLSASAPTLNTLWIGERIFWISTDQLLDDERLAQLCALFQKHADYRPTDYIVKVGIRRHGFELPIHPLTRDASWAVGHHIELRGYDSMGGYMTSSATPDTSYVFVTDLTVDQGKPPTEKEKSLFEKASVYYAQHDACAFTVPAQATPVLIRQKLNALAGIGTFEKEWSQNRKPPEYFDNYDHNILTWITRRWYRDLNKLCGRSVIRELLSRFNTHTNIVEVGFGTGNMTKGIIDWVAQQRQLAQEVGCPQPGNTHLYGIDEAPEMCKKAMTRFKDHLGWCNFHEGDFLDYLRSNFTNAGKKDKMVHIVCGTLVVHDVLNQQIEQRLPRLLETLRSVLSPDGVVLLGDVFQADSEAQWKRERDNWETGQSKEGMTPEQIRQFMELNEEMVAPVKQGHLEAVAKQYGFSTEWLYMPSSNREASPFKVCKLSASQEQPKRVSQVLL
jgi:hypothetical protein